MKNEPSVAFSKCFDPLSKYIKEKTSGPDYENMSNGLSMTTLTSNFSNISILKNHKKDIQNVMIPEIDGEGGSGTGANMRNLPSHERTFSNT